MFIYNEAMIHRRTRIQKNSFNFYIGFSTQSEEKDEKRFWETAELLLDKPPFNQKQIQAVILFEKNLANPTISEPTEWDKMYAAHSICKTKRALENNFTAFFGNSVHGDNVKLFARHSFRLKRQ